LRIRSPRISALFFVNHEARYEAARIDGGAWYSLGVGEVKLYVNFEKDIVYLYDCCGRKVKVDRRFLRPICYQP
jgi:phosphoribosyl 1,2-cyclic phosphodiesterase